MKQHPFRIRLPRRLVSSVQFRFAVTFTILVAILLALMNTYPTRASRDIVFAEKQSALTNRAAVVSSSLSLLDNLTPDNTRQVLALLDLRDLTRIIVTDSEGLAVYDSASENNICGKYVLYPELVRALDARRMLIDVSHLSDRGFWDVCGLTDRPFVATHSDSRALCRNSRNLTDEQFAEIAQRGGLVGINLYTPFLVRQSDSVLDDAIDHIERFIGMYGERIVALGCDFDGCDQLPVGIEGLGDMYRLADRMLALGYREETVRGLFYDNAFAFIQKML